MDKVMTICGTRPELIRLSRIIPKLDKVCEHILVHTGQNYDKNLNEIFFQDLGIRLPNYYMNARGTLGEQIAIIMKETEKVINEFNPDKLLILGDTNSGLSAIIAEKLGTPVMHMEAGNRSGERISEEINRHIIDSVSSINFPYTEKSKENLLREGFNPKKILVSGNPIAEVLAYYEDKILDSRILEKLKLTEGSYCLATLHRRENVDNPKVFNKVVEAYNLIANEGKKLIISTHPRTRSKMKTLKTKIHSNVNFLEPFGFMDFIALQSNAKVVLTDSGTVQEESCILHVPCVVTRTATERRETIECGASFLSGVETEDIYECYNQAIKMNINWIPPKGYLDSNVSDKIIVYILNKWK